MAALHAAMPGAPPLLSRIDREILLARAARRAASRGWLDRAPFALRPGLVALMLDFYDELRRRQRSVRRFSRTLFDELRHERGTDSGSEGLIRQTVFLGFAFLAYERLVAASGKLDEHGLRDRLLHAGGEVPARYDHIVVAVADHPSDPRGLWPVDFNLLGRLPGITALDVVVTEESHDAGFRGRIEQELPEITEAEAARDRRASSGRRDSASTPALVVPPSAPGLGKSGDPPRAWISRDREEELRDVARAIRQRFAADPAAVNQPVAIVFHRPLPYLYLAPHVLSEARVPVQAYDALPLGAEPYAALVDLVVTVARTGGTREAALALLRSRLVRFDVEGVAVGLRDIAALDGVLGARRVTGEASVYMDEVRSYFGDRSHRHGHDRVRAERAAAAAAATGAWLQPFRDADRASAQVRTLASFLRAHEVRALEVNEAIANDEAGERDVEERFARARAAVLGTLDALADGFERHNDDAREPGEIVALLHHAIESRTFMSRGRQGGVHLVDAMAARFGEFDHVHLVGLVETDWPERARQSIFYTTSLLQALGWPQEPAQVRAQQAAFRDLLSLPGKTMRLHAFELEGDSAVSLSPLLDSGIDLPAIVDEESGRRAVFPDEVLTSGVVPAVLAPVPAAWLSLRHARPSLDDRRFSGFVPPRTPIRYKVSRVERYIDCPFKDFAESVLDLPEEREEMAGLTPLEAGTLVHGLFERFYREWHADGLGTITPQSLPDALARFTALTDETLAGLPEPDRVIERTRLLGSIVARGLAERVFELEADTGGRIIDRLIEVDLAGPSSFRCGTASNSGRLRSAAKPIASMFLQTDLFA